MSQEPARMTASMLTFLAVLAAVVITFATTNAAMTETYRQRDDDKSTSYLELERVEGGAKIIRVYSRDNRDEGGHPYPLGVWFIRTAGPMAVTVTLTHGQAPSETLAIVNPEPIVVYRAAETHPEP